MQSIYSSTEKKLIIYTISTLTFLLLFETLFWGSRGFFYDEAWVANSVLEPSLHSSLFYEKVAQNTPAGLLIILRTLVSLIGNQEWVFRLPALLATFLCIPLLVLLGKKLNLSFKTLQNTCTLFALHPLVLQYSQEAKQYPLDMAVMLGLIILYLHHIAHPSNKNNILFTSASIGSFLFSYVTPFALGGIALIEGKKYLTTKKFPTLPCVQLVSITLALGLIYLIAYQPNHTPHLHQLWILNGGFPTFETWYTPFLFLITSFYKLAGAFSLPLLAPGLLALVAYGAYRLHNNPPYNQYIIGIIGVMIGTALLGTYPLSQSVITVRVQLFLLPLILIYLGEALTGIEKKLSPHYRTIFQYTVLISLLLTTLYALYLPNYSRTNDMAPVFQEYVTHHQGEDTLIANALQPEFEYYISDPKLTPEVTILISRYAQEYPAFIDTYITAHHNKTFWFIPSPATAEPRIHITKFKEHCTILYEYHHLKSELYKIRC